MSKFVVLNDDEVAITDNDDDFIASLGVEKITGMTNAYNVTVAIAKGIDGQENLLPVIAVTQRVARRADDARAAAT